MKNGGPPWVIADEIGDSHWIVACENGGPHWAVVGIPATSTVMEGKYTKGRTTTTIPRGPRRSPADRHVAHPRRSERKSSPTTPEWIHRPILRGRQPESARSGPALSGEAGRDSRLWRDRNSARMGAKGNGEIPPPTQVARLQCDPDVKSPKNLKQGLLWCVNLGDASYDIKPLGHAYVPRTKVSALTTRPDELDG